MRRARSPSTDGLGSGRAPDLAAAAARTAPAARGGVCAATSPALAEEMPSHTTAATPRSVDDLEVERRPRCAGDAGPDPSPPPRPRDRAPDPRPAASRLRARRRAWVPHWPRRTGRPAAAAPRSEGAGHAAGAAPRGHVHVLGRTWLARSTSAMRSAELARPARQRAVGPFQPDAQVTFDQRHAEQRWLRPVAAGRPRRTSASAARAARLPSRARCSPDRERGEDRAGGEQLSAASSRRPRRRRPGRCRWRQPARRPDPRGLGFEIGAGGVRAPGRRRPPPRRGRRLASRQRASPKWRWCTPGRWRDDVVPAGGRGADRPPARSAMPSASLGASSPGSRSIDRGRSSHAAAGRVHRGAEPAARYHHTRHSHGRLPRSHRAPRRPRSSRRRRSAPRPGAARPRPSAWAPRSGCAIRLLGVGHGDRGEVAGRGIVAVDLRTGQRPPVGVVGRAAERTGEQRRWAPDGASRLVGARSRAAPRRAARPSPRRTGSARRGRSPCP